MYRAPEKPQSGSIQLMLKESKQALGFSSISNYRPGVPWLIRLQNGNGKGFFESHNIFSKLSDLT